MRAAAFGIGGATPDNITLSVFSEDSSPTAFFIKPDGTKLYMLGATNKAFYQYTLSTPWDLSSASYDSVSFSVSARDSSPQGMWIKDDGAKLYMSGFTNKRVYQFTLGTPWDLSTASYDSVNFSVSTQDSAPSGLFIGDSGTKMYLAGNTNDSVYQYTLGTPWDLSTASYASKSKSVAAQETSPSGVFFKSDGTAMYIIGLIQRTIFQYNLSTPWDVSTAVYYGDRVVGSLAIVGTEALFFKSDMSKFYFSSGSGLQALIHQYSVSS